MKNCPPVSFVIAAKNAEETVRDAVNSAINQTLAPVEVVVINDGSTDKTGQILSEMARNDNRIRIIDLKESIGAGPARNLGIKESKGKYIAIMDSDDLSHPDRLEKQVELAERGGFKATGSWAEVALMNGEKIGVLKTPPVINSWKKCLIRSSIPFVHSSLMAERELLLKTKGYPDYKRAEDYLLLLRLLWHSPLASIQEPLYVYRRRILSLKKYRTSNFYNMIGNITFIGESKLPFWFYIAILPALAKTMLPIPPSLLEEIRWRRMGF